MNVPAIAQKTFEESRIDPELIGIVNFILDELKKRPTAEERAEFIHNQIEEYNQEIFSHPLVKQYSPCKMGCSGCCHTQVSVTEDEAILLLDLVDSGIKIDFDRLEKQALAGDDSNRYYKLPYADRKCVFLDEKGACKVYEHRPSVCRTNAVLGDASQCDTSEKLQPLRLVRTQKADMVIYAAYLYSKKNGTLPNLLSQLLEVV